MICKLCGKDKKLVKAHIIPKSFYEVKTYGKKTPSLLSNSQSFNPIRRPVGIYDEEILCGDCEGKFDKCDDYAFKKLILERESAQVIVDSNGDEFALMQKEYNYKLIREFILSLLLRAELTTDFFFQHVKLGPYRRKLIDYFNGKYILNGNMFSTYFFYYKEIKSGPLIVPPGKMNISDINFYHFHLGRLGFCIKVDNRSAPKYLDKILIKSNHPLIIVRKNFEGSQLHKIALSFLDNPKNEEYFAN